MTDQQPYDVAIIGGGLAGLSLSIQLARLGHSVLLMEKETYPFHRVCGEYISLESWNFLEQLGLPLSNMELPMIQQLIVTAPNGKALTQKLPLGGFGISRYLLDEQLKQIAVEAGVTVLEGCKVEDAVFDVDGFNISTNKGIFRAMVTAGSFGKRSLLDIKWKRPFVLRKTGNLVNYVGVKYHIRTAFPVDTIALHNFEDGYCGISKIEGDRYCLCYLTTAKNLRQHDNSIPAMEKAILHRNPNLQQIFQESEFLFSQPVTIAQINFSNKEQVFNHILLLGDAAGMITPLCGNGMSMALHGSKLLAPHIHAFLRKDISREELEKRYVQEWKQQFKKRLTIGRWIQAGFGKSIITNMMVTGLKRFPKLTGWLIQQTHGKPF